MDGDDTRWRPLSVLWLMLILLGTFFFIVNVFQVNSYEPTVLKNVAPFASVRKDEDEEEDEEKRFVTPSTTADEDVGVLMINTPGCRINRMDPFDRTILKYVDNTSRPETCNNGLPSLVVADGGALYVTNATYDVYAIRDTSKLSCCYRAFWRVEPAPNESDNKVKYADRCTELNETRTTPADDEEFVKVTCSYNGTEIYKEMFSFVPLKNNRTYATDDRRSSLMNVLIIGLDSISRLNLIRTMPRTYDYLKRNLGAHEFLGYNKVADNTFPNLVPALTGATVKEIEGSCWLNNSHFDDCPFVWKLYKERGYTTAFAEDSAWMGTFNYIKHGFGRQPTDYYWTIFNYVDERETGNQHKMNVFRCAGPRMVYKKLIDYNRRFVRKMDATRTPYFGFFWGTGLSHDSLNYPTIGDDDYVALLDDFARDGNLDRTALIVMSDHGMRFGSIRTTYQGMMEERLPFLFVRLPPAISRRYPTLEANLRANERRLTTHFDLHATLTDLADDLDRLVDKYDRDVISGDNNGTLKRSYSLLDRIPDTRTCESAGIDDHWCTCLNSVEVDVNDSDVSSASGFAVGSINDMLAPYADRCVNLSLTNVTSARLHTHDEHMRFAAKDYTIAFGTAPSDAAFETTVRYDEGLKTFSIVGTISRINMYGNQSHCVANFQMKLYCYCKDLLEAT